MLHRRFVQSAKGHEEFSPNPESTDEPSIHTPVSIAWVYSVCMFRVYRDPPRPAVSYCIARPTLLYRSSLDLARAAAFGGALLFT